MESKLKKITSIIFFGVLFIIIAIGMVYCINIVEYRINTGEFSYNVEPVKSIRKIFGNEENKNDDYNDKIKFVQTVQDGTDKKVNITDVIDKSNTSDNTLENLVDNVMPSIVMIECNVKTQVSDMYAYFYGGSGSQTSVSSGSGIIVAQNSQEILMVTNNHVVKGATSVYVTFSDDKKYAASIKGQDETSDLAVLSVNGEVLKDSTLDKIRIASLGDSDNLRVGDGAIAIGNAMGYGLSVTKGVISALDRSISLEDYSMKLIQTDAAINPGNSGGALVNSRGEVIGINSVKYISNNTEAIGYAIPIADAVPIINDLINYEELDEDEKAYMGITARSVSSNTASYFGCSQGVYVSEVSDDSPAMEAGLLSGDIITEFDNRTVKSMEEIESILNTKRGGSQADITYERIENGEYKEYTTTITFGNKGDY